jgi:hypothetical protein
MSYRLFFAVLLCVAMLVPLAGADEVAEQGRALFAANKDAVIMVHAVISMSRGGEERENPSWANGTIIDPSGLTVISLGSIDPASIFRGMGGAGEVTSKVVSMYMRTVDGKEIPAEVVLRDNELDLAYVRPIKAPEAPLPFVDPANMGTPELLDTVAVIAQLGEVARHAHTILLTRIESVVTKPRTYYVPGEDRSRAIISAPAFTMEGKFVGMGAMRTIKKGSPGGMSDNALVVLVPAEEIVEGMKQAPPVAE